ncbi:PDZ domain-containing protein, partial [Weissella paramesenteroides]
VSMVDLSNVSTSDQSNVLHLPSSVSGGVVVVDTEDNSPAANAGLTQYDVITKIDGKRVSNSGDLRDALYKHKIGDSVQLTYYHKGKEKTVTVKLNKSTSSLSSAQ